MQIRELLLKRRREFNISVSLMGIIPMLVLVYLLVARVASFEILIGEIGLIILCTIAVFVLGIVEGKRMLQSLFAEVMEKQKLAAINETTLALSHEINNPLLTVRGNIELLEGEFPKELISESIQNRLNVIKSHCERIRIATEKLAKISRPVSTAVYGDTKMVDINKSG